MKTDKEIIFSLEDYTAIIKINRPPHNFFDTKLISQIADILEEMDNENQCRSIILCSEGKNFCAGADFSKSNFTNGDNIYENLYKQALRLFRTDKPIIASIQGAAIGGG
ncbi:MAG: enoyl-CoA hydratase/isomerase family protein, partial [Alphaproteobacteria bacterium]